MKRFCRSENFYNERFGPHLWWMVYEAKEEGDFRSGSRIAAFASPDDARKFVEDGCVADRKDEP